jgi:hypothetical protein
MKRIALLLALLCIVLSSCGGDSGTSPGDGEENPLAADTVGTEGGTIAADGFELTVPPGAFSSRVELALYESDEDHGLGDECMSRFYRLEGLPAEFGDSLMVRIDYDGALSGSTYVVTGREVVFYADDMEPVEDFLYSFHPATESAGSLRARIPPQQSAAALGAARGLRAASGSKNFFAAVSGIDVHKSSEHVKVTYPLGVFAFVDDVVDYIEAAHDTVVAVGMGYAGKPWNWPVQVLVRDFRGAGPTRARVSPEGMYVQIRKDFLTEPNLPDLRLRMGNAMVYAAQNIPGADEYLHQDNIAWNFAVISYMQQKWTEPGTFLRPTVFPGNESYALQGLPIGIPESIRDEYGVGWSPVVKHLAGLYGRSLIGDVYKVTQTTTRNPVEVLFEEIPDPAYNWWPQFVDKYVTGKYYGVESSLLLSRIASGDRFTLSSASDTLKQFSRNVPQVSALLHRVNLDYALIAEDAALEIRMAATEVNEDYMTLLVYRTKDGVVELLGSDNPYTVNGLRDLTLAGYDIVPVQVVSYNDEPYTGDVATKVECRVTSPPPYNWAFISLNSVNAHFVDCYDNEWWDDSWGEMWEGYGTWNGNTFHAAWTDVEQQGSGTNSGSLTITVDPDTRDVVSFRAVETLVSPIGFTFVDSIVGQNVPLYDQTTDPNPHRLCMIVGTGTCSSVGTFAYKRSNEGMGTWIELDSFNCRTATGLSISLWRDPDH